MNTHIRDVLTKAANAGLNVLLEGHYGTGKSSICARRGGQLKLQLKYFSASNPGSPSPTWWAFRCQVIEGDTRRILYLGRKASIRRKCSSSTS